MKSSSKVFISFKTEDIEIARLLREKLVLFGYRVWWQEDLQLGQEWHGEIDRAVREAGAVLVLWSDKSMMSKWVMHEASQSIINGTYTPVRIALFEISDPYSRIQATDLINWDGDTNHPGFQNLLFRLDELLPKPVKFFATFVWSNRMTMLAVVVAFVALSLLTLQVQKQNYLLLSITDVSSSFKQQEQRLSKQIVSSREILRSLRLATENAELQSQSQSEQAKFQSSSLNRQLVQQEVNAIKLSKALRELSSLTFSLDSLSLAFEIDSMNAWRVILGSRGLFMIVPQKDIIRNKLGEIDLFRSIHSTGLRVERIGFSIESTTGERNSVIFSSNNIFGKLGNEKSDVRSTLDLDGSLLIYRASYGGNITSPKYYIDSSLNLSLEKRKLNLTKFSPWYHEFSPWYHDDLDSGRNNPYDGYQTFKRQSDSVESKGFRERVEHAMNALFVIRKLGTKIYSTSEVLVARDFAYYYYYATAIDQESFDSRVTIGEGRVKRSSVRVKARRAGGGTDDSRGAPKMEAADAQ